MILKEKILEFAQDKRDLKLDLTQCEYVDHSVMEQIDELRSYFEIQGVALLVDISNHHALGHSNVSSQKKTA